MTLLLGLMVFVGCMSTQKYGYSRAEKLPRYADRQQLSLTNKLETSTHLTGSRELRREAKEISYFAFGGWQTAPQACVFPFRFQIGDSESDVFINLSEPCVSFSDYPMLIPYGYDGESINEIDIPENDGNTDITKWCSTSKIYNPTPGTGHSGVSVRKNWGFCQIFEAFESAPTIQPSSSIFRPTAQPITFPTMQPTAHPSTSPTVQTSSPFPRPMNHPSNSPTMRSTMHPSFQPTVPTNRPSSKNFRPTENPTSSSTPTIQPSKNPFVLASSNPTGTPTIFSGMVYTPTLVPTESPSINTTNRGIPAGDPPPGDPKDTPLSTSTTAVIVIGSTLAVAAVAGVAIFAIRGYEKSRSYSSFGEKPAHLDLVPVMEGDTLVAMSKDLIIVDLPEPAAGVQLKDPLDFK